jgi:hypothetical protein
MDSRQRQKADACARAHAFISQHEASFSELGRSLVQEAGLGAVVAALAELAETRQVSAARSQRATQELHHRVRVLREDYLLLVETLAMLHTHPASRVHVIIRLPKRKAPPLKWFEFGHALSRDWLRDPTEPRALGLTEEFVAELECASQAVLNAFQVRALARHDYAATTTAIERQLAAGRRATAALARVVHREASMTAADERAWRAASQISIAKVAPRALPAPQAKAIVARRPRITARATVAAAAQVAGTAVRKVAGLLAG